MSASEAALMWFGLTGFSRAAAASAADGLAATFVDFAADSAFAVTVFAIARTSSRLKAIGFVAALRARMLSRSADFLDGFSMVGRFPGTAWAAAGALRGGSLPQLCLRQFLLGRVWFFLSCPWGVLGLWTVIGLFRSSRPRRTSGRPRPWTWPRGPGPTASTAGSARGRARSRAARWRAGARPASPSTRSGRRRR